MKLTSRTLLLTVVASLAFAGQDNNGQQGNGNNGGQQGNNQGQHDDHQSPDLPSKAANANGWVDVIIQFKVAPSKSLLKYLGIYGYDGGGQNSWNDNYENDQHHFNKIKAIRATLPAALIPILAKNPLIAYITPNRKTKSTLDIVTQTVNAPMAWSSGLDGRGIGVAVLDSGVASKRDLMNSNGSASRIVYSESFVAGSDASDQFGHGTHVAGIVAANGAASTGPNFKRTLKGVAPNTNIINLKVLDANGQGNISDVIAAIDRAIELKNTYNIRVMNLSLGTPVYESYTLDPLCQEVEAAWKAGIVVVVAAGNYGRSSNMGVNGYGTIGSPGNDPYVITVGATKTNGTPYRFDDTVASYSSKGPTAFDHVVKPDLVAPGNNVVSLMAPNCTIATLFPSARVQNSYYQTNAAPGNSTEYFRLSGTSMATPVVAGTAALMLQKQPSLTPDQVKARLMKTATKIFPLYSTNFDEKNHNSFNIQSDIFAVGAGYLDANAALNSTDLVTLPALSPTVTYNAVNKHVYLLHQALTWGDALIWGDLMTWGNSVFVNGTALIWGDAMTWGDATTSGFALIWGDSVTASTAILAMDADDGDQDPTS
jgi:serine protease AprX